MKSRDKAIAIVSMWVGAAVGSIFLAHMGVIAFAIAFVGTIVVSIED
jgi:hypothetical protein